MKQHYVEYLTATNSTFYQEIAERRIEEMPKATVGYRFFDNSPEARENVSEWLYKVTRNGLEEQLKAFEKEPSADYWRKKLKKWIAKLENLGCNSVLINKDEQIVSSL